ncbi:DUF6665 family protein [Pelagibacterium nitratireducens]|uniref:DUF6665 family protein n=1 Tax=Pelagibacterium nitratireducens TaxID=1046114 RepID=A0ABZ2I3A6_9HYPH|nr:hypothetical protein [Pelagibacterium sp.]HCO54601.1 hypothetical protein [Pelagibacterium sp.]|tara:strand:+ start:17163 stop:17477 length:315 start_codon:yes stop_codon:yes gene_type:complete
MSLRDSLDLIKAVNPEGGHAVLENEIMGERAASLGAAEQRVAKTVAAYNAATPGQRTDQLTAAQNAVWAYFVQRELCGFKRHQDVIAAFAIPREVLNGLGAVHR